MERFWSLNYMYRIVWAVVKEENSGDACHEIASMASLDMRTRAMALTSDG